MKKTPWFSDDVKPARAGLYELHPRHQWAGQWCWFDGTNWCNASDLKEIAIKNQNYTAGAFQNKTWRGLAEEPK